MKLLAKYVKDQYIDIFVEGITPSDKNWDNLQLMLQKAKFHLNGFAYRRTEFYELPDESFKYWLNATAKLTKQFGNTEPVEVQDPMQNLMDMIKEFEARYNELHQEVVSLKKFDAIAQQRLSELKQQLEQVDKKPARRKKK
jgi:hypothetical protein